MAKTSKVKIEEPAETDEKESVVGSEGEGEASEGGDGAAPKKKSGLKKILLFVALPLLALVAIGAGLYFTGMLNGLLGKKEGETAAEEHGAKTEGEHGSGATAAFLPIPTIIVNLSSEEGAPRYLRLTVQLELENQEDLHAVEAVVPRVIDQFQTYLRELRVKDLRGSAGIYRLQMELLWRVNQAAAPVEVKDVLFQEILIQ